MTNRRDFLKIVRPSSASGRPCRRSSARTALAAPDAGKPGAKDTILVVVQLTGGNDGLNTVIPYKDDLYAKLPADASRSPTDQVKKVNDSIGLHPSLDGLAELLEDKAAVRRAGRRLPEPEPVALPVDGHLAGRQHRRDAHRGLGRPGAEDDERRRPSTSPGNNEIAAAGAERLAGPRAVDHSHRRLPAQDRRSQRATGSRSA